MITERRMAASNIFHTEDIDLKLGIPDKSDKNLNISGNLAFPLAQATENDYTGRKDWTLR